MPDLSEQVRTSPSPAPCSQSEASSLQEQICDNLFDGVYVVDKERKIYYWNDGAVRLTGYASEEVIGKQCFDSILGHVDDEGCSLCHAGCPLSATLGDGERREVELYLRHKQGHRVPVCVRVAPVKDASGAVIGAVEIFADISSKKALEWRTRELEAMAYLDPLTRLSNRRHIELKVRQAIQESDEFGKSVGLLMIDIDHFKEVNDRFGHMTGDVVLKTVADTILHSLRPGDSAGRWGGEEFLVVAMDVDLKELEAIGERLRKLIPTSETQLQNHSINVTASIGGTLMVPRQSSDVVLARADELLYQSKSLGRNRTTVR
jgi:diguanylate cyclase (GGDEF)-like protein/PAS domain S-box-containing protein